MTAQVARKLASFDFVAFSARLRTAIVSADKASANILTTVLELRGHADADKARELFKDAYTQATAELRGVEPETLEKDVVVRSRVSDCMAIFGAAELPEGMSTRSVQNAAKACRDAAKPAGEKAQRAPRQPVGKGETLSPTEALAISLELLREQAGKLKGSKAKKALELVADLADLAQELASVLGE